DELQTGGLGIELALSVSPELPYRQSALEATVTVFPLRTRADFEAALRVTAPKGYEWYFSDQGFLFRAGAVPGATADLPGGVPSRRGNVLTWTSAPHLGRHTYGFS
ncbi:unnamed protein product, partial [Polarella glacialis]